jgi:hypothetical protein
LRGGAVHHFGAFRTRINVAMVAGLITELTQVDLQRLRRSLAAKWRKPLMLKDIVEAGATAG